MTIGDKILNLNLEIQNLQHNGSSSVFSTTIPQKLQEIKEFAQHLLITQQALSQTSSQCIQAIEQSIEHAKAALADIPPSDFLKEKRLLVIKESIRKALLTVYDNCSEEKVNLANQEI